MSRHIYPPARLLVPAILLAALLHAQSVRAEVRIAGVADAVRVDARDAPIEEVLAALGQSFGLRYRSTASLDRKVTETYEGSLPRVVRRLLEGYDFILKTQSGTVEVVVIGTAKLGDVGTAKPGNAGAAAVAPVRRGRSD